MEDFNIERDDQEIEQYKDQSETTSAQVSDDPTETEKRKDKTGKSRKGIAILFLSPFMPPCFEMASTFISKDTL